MIYDYELKNINHIEKNAAAIDLYDRKNRISVQVTCDNDSTKIHHTIKEFVSHKYYEEYNRLVILILTEKKRYSTDFSLDTGGKIAFDKEKDIWDTEDLIKHISTLEIDKLENISCFLQKELSDKSNVEKRTQASEIDTIIDLIEYISKHKKVNKKIDSVIDPDYKIYKRFRAFAEKLMNDFTRMYSV